MSGGGIEKLLGERVRIWDGMHSSVFVEGKAVGVSIGQILFVETFCKCGERQVVGNSADLPIDVQTWVPSSGVSR